MKILMLRYLILLGVSSTLFYFDYLEAQNLSKAFDYLVNSQHEDGYWEHTNTEKASFEALYTLKLFEIATNTYSKGKEWYDYLVYFETPVIARKILMLHLLGGQVSLDSLLTNQNTDGGFGHRKGDPSNIVDSLSVWQKALCYIALLRSGQVLKDTYKHMNLRMSLLNSLKESQRENGSWLDCPYNTAFALRALYYSEICDPPIVSWNFCLS